jgi:hypothetical protein
MRMQISIGAATPEMVSEKPEQGGGALSQRGEQGEAGVRAGDEGV